MVRLIAVSDTHGDREILATILTQQPGADAYLYAGDAELSATDPLFDTYQAVRGNMDFDAGFPYTRTLDVAGVRVFLTHGHRYGVNYQLEELVEAGQAANADLVVFGHTHQLGVEQHAGMVLLNPGSISQPRGQFASLHGTYAVIDVTPTAITVTYHLRDGALAPDLQRTFARG
ncbi:metallophosphoesterase [Lacticaseibacillus absianus]|uniref:metallophosphoesterase n=1 Tax=Lacticaseibacillus absianus TaxID=2729623 RepID=UPI0015CA136B|nr:metallophosphoesterase [Lacticaseibacillus absianus]